MTIADPVPPPSPPHSPSASPDATAAPTPAPASAFDRHRGPGAEGRPLRILLTGASRGIGAAAHDALVARGHQVIALSSADGDLADPATPDRLWASATADGPVDILINNAGIFEKNPPGAAGDPAAAAAWTANWARTIAVNLTASSLLARAAVTDWLGAGRHGRIVNIASRAGHRGDSPDHWHYAASKAGMIGVTKTIARAYAACGITAIAICPGFVVTGMAEDYIASRGGAGFLADIPLGRPADPDEIAAIIAFAALDAPPSMTGAVLDANGASHVR